ncbi:HIT family protein [Dysgonomonas sp. 521]|uniref:HIT family protein n=1 Tax=Dysgonomonas sp. 521 TaxID=2302932 RepID=UPI0013D323AE|nr:HIT family protein [Dysgonomonas sp. 521]NDV95456.1 HIT family protein [Dysgonomonas sp. 521]
MNENFVAFQEKFKVEEFKIYESKFWIWSLRPVHNTLGAGILSLKRYTESFSDISEEEGSDLALIVKVIERALKVNFTYDRINYLMLMMVDPHLHYHVIPRYSIEQEFDGQKFKDEGWPKLPQLTAPNFSSETLHKIKDLLIKSSK